MFIPIATFFSPSGRILKIFLGKIQMIFENFKVDKKPYFFIASVITAHQKSVFKLVFS